MIPFKTPRLYLSIFNTPHKENPCQRTLGAMYWQGFLRLNLIKLWSNVARRPAAYQVDNEKLATYRFHV